MKFNPIKKIIEINIYIIFKRSLSYFSILILLGFFNPISGSTKSRYNFARTKVLEENQLKNKYQFSKISWEKIENNNSPQKKIRWEPIDSDHYYLIKESSRRRKIQDEYNKKHNIEPATVQKSTEDILSSTSVADSMSNDDEIIHINKKGDDFSKMDKKLALEMMRQEMIESAERLDFERAAKLRDEIKKLEQELSGVFN